MMKLKYLFENYALAKKCMALYGYDEDSADEMLERFRISSNAVYPFRSGDSTKRVLILRISPVEEKRIEDVLWELRLLGWLRERGINAMEPVPMKDGRLAAVIDTEWGSYNVSCFERMAGADLEDADCTLDTVRGYGRSLGELHNALKLYPYGGERRDHTALIGEVRERLTALGAPKLMLDELFSVENELSALPVIADSYGIIHYDYEPDNVFYDARTDSFGIIDFDDAIRCWFALDVVRSLDALDDVAEDADDEAARVFLAGYREARAFSDAEEAALPLMQRLVLLQGYATILYSMSDAVPSEPDWLIELRAKLTRRLRSMEAAVRELQAAR